MEQQILNLEYVFSGVSPGILWKSIATAAGLGEWFADDVKANGNEYAFTWHGVTELATLVFVNNMSSIRFSWDDEPEGTYFEFEIHTDDLTNVTSLKVTDFCEPGEVDQTKLLWNSQIEDLRRFTGM